MLEPEETGVWCQQRLAAVAEIDVLTSKKGGQALKLTFPGNLVPPGSLVPDTERLPDKQQQGSD